MGTPAMILCGSGAILLLAGLAGAAGAVGGIIGYSGSVPPGLRAVSRRLCVGLGTPLVLGALLLLAALSVAATDPQVPAAQPAQTPAAQTVARAVPPQADMPAAGGAAGPVDESRPR